MNRHHGLLIAAGVVVVLGGGIVLGRLSKPAVPATAAAPEARKPLYYRNPMGLPDTSPVPKQDEMGMDYIPVYAEDEANAAPGIVVLSPEKIQTLGVRTEAVRRQRLDPGLQASGTIVVDETRQHVIAPRFDGWVASLQANQTGMAVRRGQILATVYSPQLLAAQEDYRLADAALRQLRDGDAASLQSMQRLRDAARRRLLNWGIDAGQLEHLAHLQPGNLAITAPVAGVIVEKPVVQGARFGAGDTLLRLADLSTVWVTVNVPATQIGRVRLGQHARFTSPALAGQVFAGQVGFLQPVLDTATRTLAVRVALPNPDSRLRPGLFGTVDLIGDSGHEALTIPRSALIDSGQRQLTLIEVAPGRFAPRQITTGLRSGDRVEVLDGVHEGERVVVEGNFLIDAESNLRAALQGMATAQPAAPAHDTGAHDMIGHGMPAADGARAEHAMPTASKPDPHAGHVMPAAPKPDPHADHEMPPPKADPHANHDMSDRER
ncbi:MAG: efflux RND transporter periplasmic adaptor subunit [Thermomonas sp.]|uniref:efflux RND transporter periplasmic adaptor subunit n=1 Tax=Thermomonas sp. TaxID=1971895 RepID=UPI0026089EEC|nr:efflux RND transporter periplasmic adaptor subunit [Thermomonas sp.]MCC7097847.1 efflux RND transporter periplasmic adaptor subunit [Thermomonas sp.]